MTFEEHLFENKPFENVYVFDVHVHTDSNAPFQLVDATEEGLAFTAKRLDVNGLCTSSLTANACAALSVSKAHDNIFIDTAVSCTVDGSVEWLVHNIGVDHVVYGSDNAFFDCTHTIGKIALARISDEQKEQIFGLNSKKIFRV